MDITKDGTTDSQSPVDTEVGEVTNTNSGYHRNFTPRQIHVISLGGQIGAGLFISTGSNLREGGPANLLLGFAVVCSCVWAVLQTVSEMTIAFPTSGNFIDYADRFVDPAFAFAAGFSMWIGWTAVIASEATFFSVVVNYWAKDKVNEAVWLTIFLILMFAIFSLPSTVFGWFEYFTSMLKIIALILFIIVGIALIFGAGPDGTVNHGETWDNGVAFLNGFKGFGNSVLFAILAIGDNTFTGFLAGESRRPRYSVAHAAFLIPIRVAVFYLVSVVLIGLLVSPKNPHLLGSSGVAASPFVIAINQAGIPVLPDILNVVIVFAVAAIAAESFYIASRILQSMAHQGLITSWVSKIDSRGRPYISLSITGLLAIILTYINLSAGGTTVFDWLAQIGSDTPTAYYFFQYMFGMILIIGSALAYKLIFRTKIRDVQTVDLITGRRPLSVEEIRELDEYEKSPRWRKFYSFVQLW
ncbi:hypothetical protein UA08_06583 [Talaromyces atroroseus]|uniref:Amino acid permease/ SLC12A domain-containing protein n=1 Tax=Talaromyces atroroseus TaxID=1441469 RepID=A0A225AG52_TALAT|nr:hypothetical protein UA08_06583 [Talaromyces atroroseus]OKL58133.1 hypothetical protein UA08_06583 [Talaromyces atroroseus]